MRRAAERRDNAWARGVQCCDAAANRKDETYKQLVCSLAKEQRSYTYNVGWAETANISWPREQVQLMYCGGNRREAGGAFVQA